MTARYWIDRLGMVRHPEGGWFRETYRSLHTVPAEALPPRYSGSRSFATSICFLLEGDDFSAFHRIASDEIWYFHCGSTLAVHVITAGGEYREMRLGNDPASGAEPQAVVCGGSWFGATVLDRSAYALVGCAVSPGFDFRDFELGRRELLLSRYPWHSDIITRLTRPVQAERY